MKTVHLCFGTAIACLATRGTFDGAQARQELPKKTNAANMANRAFNQWGQFGTALSALSEKYRMALVCESAPISPTLSPEAAISLQKTCAAPNITAQEAITAVADAYDYGVAFVDGKTAVLSKRYTDPQDLPEITFDEATAFLNHLRDETKPFLVPHPSATALIVDLLRYASPEKEAVYAKGVRWDELPASFQKAFAYDQAWSGIGSSLKSVDDLANRLNGLRQPNRTVFKMASFQGASVLAYEGPFRAPNATGLELVPLDTTVRATPGGGITISTSIASANGVTVPSPPAVPSASGTLSLSKPLLPCQQTLKHWADGVNARSQKGGGTQNGLVRVEVPAGIAGKTVSLFGTETLLTPAQTLKAVAQALGLHGGLGSDGTARILLPTVRTLSDPGQIAPETLRLMPETLLRALRRHTRQPGFPQPLPGQIAIDPAKADAMYSVVVERLRKTVEPKLATSAEKTLPVDGFSAETKDALALSNLVGNADIFEPLLQLQERRSLWQGKVPGSASVTITRKADGTLFHFSSPAVAGSNGISMNIAFGPIPR